MNDYMDLNELASYLCMPPTKLRTLVVQGRVPGVKIGNMWRFYKEDIDEWMADSGGNSLEVLVVVNDRAARNAVIRELKKAGHAAEGAGAWRKAAVLLKNKQFDMLLLDLSFPDGVGLGPSEARIIPAGMRVVVVFVDSSDSEALKHLEERTSHITVMRGPVDPEAVRRAAKQLAAHKG